MRSPTPQSGHSKTLQSPGSFTSIEGEKRVNPRAPLEIEKLKRDAPLPADEDVRRLIEEVLYAADVGDRAFAVSELGSLDPSSEVLSACRRALKDREEEVRLEAILALEMLEDVTAVPVLKEEAAKDSSEKVRKAARQALDFLISL